MASITIRKLDQNLKARLRVRAARHARSMEQEVREILRVALAEGEAPVRNLAQAVHERFASVGGVELVLPSRVPLRMPPEFEP